MAFALKKALKRLKYVKTQMNPIEFFRIAKLF